MTEMETYCTECGRSTQATTPHCPDCGAEDPWDERPAYQFDESDLPFVFGYEVYNDNYELWETFCSQYFGQYELNGEDIAGLPDEMPRLKYCVFDVYFVITADYDLKGPFLSKSDARDAGEDDDQEAEP